MYITVVGTEWSEIMCMYPYVVYIRGIMDVTQYYLYFYDLQNEKTKPKWNDIPSISLDEFLHTPNSFYTDHMAGTFINLFISNWYKNKTFTRVLNGRIIKIYVFVNIVEYALLASSEGLFLFSLQHVTCPK